MYYICTTQSGNVRIRESPSLSSTVIGKCIRGETYQSDTIVDGDGLKWLLINNGYACADYFILKGDTNPVLSFSREDLVEIKTYIERMLEQ